MTDSITLTINGERRELLAANVLDVVVELTGIAFDAEGKSIDGRRLGIAVALGHEVVPRGAWLTTPIADGDSIEVVVAKQGG